MQWLQETGEYVTDSLQIEGFIHCCNAVQLPGVLERYYAKHSNLVLLTIDTGSLEAKLVFENTVGGSEDFAHIYGPINKDAVIAMEPLDRTQIDMLIRTANE